MLPLQAGLCKTPSVKSTVVNFFTLDATTAYQRRVIFVLILPNLI
ncbi:hypothetical protein TOL_0390 [Thalassolituus oleivorans MIL-1]|uniref:Uncharacterized protein n=1 Tax=Thalassolituus oleivorans MIL-1 TaxID=1298593 RepID=M5DNV5_9GAMM|nr:hypothetical protein TOL_0390 [Thalassolituus oleivorans MIL-1]